MGLFSGIGKIFKKVASVALPIAGSALGGPLGGIAGDLLGTALAGKQAKDAASTAWDRTMDASNTSYQRAVADMRAANLNPILAYSQGGASTPTAQVASTSAYDELGKAGSKSINNAFHLAQIENTKAQTEVASQQKYTSHAQELLDLENARREKLNNEGLEKIPPHIRALATMAGSTGSALAGGATVLKTFLKKGK